MPPIAAGRMNFPSRHPLNHTLRSGPAIAEGDVVVGLEIANFFGATNTYRDQLERSSKAATKTGAKLVTITAAEMNAKSNYQDFQRYAEVDLALSGDAEATLPALIEAVKRQMTADRKRAIDDRGTRLAAASQAARDPARADATDAGTGRPSAPRASRRSLGAGQGRGLVACERRAQRRQRLWNFGEYTSIGVSGGTGIGYGAPAAVGAALANRKYGRLSISLQNDGDLMYAPGILWTAAHHKIPILFVMNNNRAYHEEVMHLQRMAGRRERGIDRANIGTEINNPAINFTKLADSMGVHAEGPILSPSDLAPAIKRAIATVKSGEPALIDVVMQPR